MGGWGMKSKILVLMTIILSFFTILSGCTYEDKKLDYVTSNSSVNTALQDTFKLTIDDINKKYTEDKITNINQFKEGYVLVESVKETIGNRFDLYNLRTGEKDSLPIPQFGIVSLEQIVNENYFIFLSSGKDNDGPIGNFPYIIRCIRVKNEIDKSDNFTSLIEDKYFSLDKSAQSGSKEWDEMSKIYVTLDGFQVLFSPIKGNETGFYADATDIPPTRTYYDKNRKQITFEIGAKQLGDELKGMKRVNLDNNQYISSYEINQNNGKVYLIVDVKDITKEYMIKTKRLPEGQMPFISVIFR
jgi:hypothetical protein